MDGNERFVSRRECCPNRSLDRACAVADAQHPFAAVLGCSDSRESMEVIFDCGIGDLFVVRIAGNVCDDLVLGSLEFAATELEVPLILVLGHENCGAVQAALQGEAPGHMAALLAAIKPAADWARGQQGDPVEQAVRRNVRNVATQLRENSSILDEQCRREHLRIAAAYHNLHTGRVELLA